MLDTTPLEAETVATGPEQPWERWARAQQLIKRLEVQSALHRGYSLHSRVAEGEQDTTDPVLSRKDICELELRRGKFPPLDDLLPDVITVGFEHLDRQQFDELERIRNQETMQYQQDVIDLRSFIHERIGKRSIDIIDVITYRLNGQLTQLYAMLHDVDQLTEELDEAHLDAGELLFKAAGGIVEAITVDDIKNCYRTVKDGIRNTQELYHEFICTYDEE